MQFIHAVLATPYGALAALLLVIVAGEVVGKKTKGTVPMALFVLALMLTFFWTGVFPKEIAATAGFSATLFSVACMLLVVNLGTIINRKQMISQWRTVLISLIGVAAIILICMTIGTMLFGRSVAAAATGPLSGAAVATAMVSQAAAAVGKPEAATVAIVIMSIQSILGMPMTSFCLRKESRSLMADYKAGLLTATAKAEETSTVKKACNDSTSMALFKLTLLGGLGFLMERLTAMMGFSISMYVWAMILGFVARQLNLLDEDALSKANCYGMCMTIMMVFLFGSMGGNDLQTILSMLVAAATLVILSAIGMAGAAFIASKIFKNSFWLCYAVALNSFLGFPTNVIVVNEVLDVVTSTPEERAAITDKIMPPMLIASFTSVTVCSVIVAGIMIRFI